MFRACQAFEPLNAVKSGLGFNLPGLCWLALKRAGSPYLLPRVSWTHGFKNVMTRPPPKKKMDKTSFPKSRHSWRQMIIQSGVHRWAPHYPLVPICLWIAEFHVGHLAMVYPWFLWDYCPSEYIMLPSDNQHANRKYPSKMESLMLSSKPMFGYQRVYHTVLYSVMSCQLISRNVISRHIISYHIIIILCCLRLYYLIL